MANDVLSPSYKSVLYNVENVYSSELILCQLVLMCKSESNTIIKFEVKYIMCVCYVDLLRYFNYFTAKYENLKHHK